MKLSKLTTTLALGATILTLGVSGAFAAATLDTSVDVLAGPGSHFKPIAKLQAGQTVQVSRQANGDWCRISANGATGWVSCTDINGLTKAKMPSASPITPAPDASGDAVLNTLHENNTQTHTFS